MIKDHQNHTPAEIRQFAERWFERQIKVISQAHGASWPSHREWIEDYLRAELRERLIILGWRPKQ